MYFHNLDFIIALVVRNSASGNALVGLLTAAEFGLPTLIIAILGAIGAKKVKQTDEDAQFIRIDEKLYQKMITFETLRSLSYIVGVIALFAGVIILAMGRASADSGRIAWGIAIGVIGIVLFIASLILTAKIKAIRQKFKSH